MTYNSDLLRYELWRMAYCRKSVSGIYCCFWLAVVSALRLAIRVLRLT